MSVLDCLFNTVTQILRKNVDKKALFDNIEVRGSITTLLNLMFVLVPMTTMLLTSSQVYKMLTCPQVIMLAMDEMIDGGMIMECDPTQVKSRRQGWSLQGFGIGKNLQERFSVFQFRPVYDRGLGPDLGQTYQCDDY